MTTKTNETPQANSGSTQPSREQVNAEPLKIKVSRPPFHQISALPCVALLW